MTCPSNFNYQELQDFLFESPINNTQPSKTEEFDFAKVWQGLNAKSIEDMDQKQSALSAFVGDITPAAAAVAAADESPMMDTPFLDNSCMNTPFTPATVFTPSLGQFQNSPYYSPYIESFGVGNLSYQDDIQVAKYLKNDISWQPSTMMSQTPLVSSTDLLNSFEFNGEPSQLLLDSSNNNISTDESSDFLFPPLPSENNQQDTTSYSLNTNFNSQELDATNLFDDCFFDIQEETVFPEQLSNKRKTEDDKPNKKNKRVKISSSKAVKNDQDQRKFECDICHATFNRRYNLGTHVKTHDKNRTKAFSCSLCQKPFDRKHDLSRHVSTVHNGERAYSCTECPSTFSRKDALVRHQIQKHNYES